MWSALLVACCIAASLAFAQTPPVQITATERSWVAAKLYSSVRLYFSHWEGVPGLDLDRAFRDYLDRAMGAPDRQAFDMASMKFMAELHNGHSGFSDDWLGREYGQPLGFTLETLPEGWVVTESGVRELEPGDIVSQIDGRTFEDFYREQARYIAGSSDRSRREALNWAPFLWPERFELLLANGKRVRIDRRGQEVGTFRGFPMHQPQFPASVGYISIRSFESAKGEQEAIAAVRAKSSAATLIVDVRGNGGGNTPTELMRTLMDRPWQDFQATTRIHIADVAATNSVRQWLRGSELTDYLRGQLEQAANFEDAELLYPGERYDPSPTSYRGKVIILIDQHCFSACEDFVEPFATTHRALLVGEATGGSSGQPFYYNFGNGMSFRVGSRRYRLPDGRPYEGVGLTPDVEVRSTLADLLAGRDAPLERAVYLATDGKHTP
jgi:carboxyl-terminal processing protease